MAALAKDSEYKGHTDDLRVQAEGSLGLCGRSALYCRHLPLNLVQVTVGGMYIDCSWYHYLALVLS